MLSDLQTAARQKLLGNFGEKCSFYTKILKTQENGFLQMKIGNVMKSLKVQYVKNIQEINFNVRRKVEWNENVTKATKTIDFPNWISVQKIVSGYGIEKASKKENHKWPRAQKVLIFRRAENLWTPPSIQQGPSETNTLVNKT